MAIPKSAVVAQATDDSLPNTEPVALSQVVAQAVGVLVNIAILSGYIPIGDGPALTENTLLVFGAVQTLAGIIGAAVGRARASSPRTVAEVAVTNAVKPASATPTLVVDDAAVEAAVVAVR